MAITEAEYVRWVKGSLNRLLDAKLPDNGDKSVDYRIWVMNFQTNESLPTNGNVDAATQNLLTKRNRNALHYPLWVRNALLLSGEGQSVGGKPIAYGDYWGPDVEAAVKIFQGKNGLTKDGFVGAKTETALMNRTGTKPPGRAGAPKPTPKPVGPGPKPVTPKQAAIDLVKQFAAQTGPGVWPKLSRATLAAGLIDRINDPDRIDQSATPLCGPASVIRALATDNPVNYAQAAIDLYLYGSGKIGTRRVHPGLTLRQASPAVIPAKVEDGIRYGAVITHDADWIMLASLRDADNWFFSPGGWFGSNIAGVTRPATMEKWFRTAGYTQIISSTYVAAKPNSVGLANDALRASNLYGQGYKVVLLIDSDMLDADSQDDVVSLYPDHWIALNSPIRDGGQNHDAPVSLQIYTWGSSAAIPGKKRSIPVDPSQPLSKRKFLHKFYGFVAARR